MLIAKAFAVNCSS